MLRATLAALLLTAAPALAHEGEHSIEIHGAYAIAPRPNAPTGAAFMLIHNHTSTPDRLIAAASPVAETVEVHNHEEVDGVMRMRPVEGGVEIPAGRPVLFQRGGLHLMFMGVTDSFEDGDMIPVTLTFEEAGEIAVEVPVDLDRLTEGGDAPAAAEGHDHGSSEAGNQSHGAGDDHVGH